MKTSAVIRSMRGPFLILSPVCVFLGASTATVNRDNLYLLLHLYLNYQLLNHKLQLLFHLVCPKVYNLHQRQQLYNKVFHPLE